jgi:hypothetical protein
MWNLDQGDFAFLRGGGGEPFTHFVDALIRAHGFVHGVGEAEILTSLRANVADGGVDTQVRRAMDNDSTEFLRVPTCWQYKAMSHSDISEDDLIQEVRKPYAAELIAQGYGYRLAICDSMVATKQTDWEDILTRAARRINPQAPEARVVTASQLTSWANKYPPLIPACFPRDPGPVLFFEAWAPSITKATPEFVPVREWRDAEERIEGHVNLLKPTIHPIITLQGMAGVGKSRLVYEILAKMAGVGSLVFYTMDGDDAVAVARYLANDRRTRGVLIADECPVLSRAGITKVLRGHTDRVRVVCIDNSGERLAGSEAELWLEQLSSAVVEEVLERNFPLVPRERRHTYAEQSGGYIRLAADMCERDAEIQIRGHFGPALDAIHEYYRQRLPDEGQQQAVEAIALLQKVGFGEGVADELDALCAFTDQDRGEVLQSATVLKDAPGFIARTTRYLYVTPEIIARVAFARAWRRWFEADPAAALRRVPPILLASFQARVGQSASWEVGAQTGQFFWDSAVNLKPSDLADESVTERLATLIDTDPDRYFPRFTSLIRDATFDELRQCNEDSGRSRRRLVWTAERMAAFPKYFPAAEEILRRLALAETEKGISNNATGVWKGLFRIQLSGTAVPFPDRMGLLGKLLFSSNPEETALALQALEETLNFTGVHLVGPSVVAGQLVPPDWRPSTFREFQECSEQVLALFDRLLDQGGPTALRTAWRLLASNLRALLSNHLLPTLRVIFQRHSVPEDYLSAVLASIEDFLEYECGGASGSVSQDPLWGPYCREVNAWLTSLTPGDFVGRLKTAMGKDPWHHSRREESCGLPSEIVPLAEELIRDQDRFETVLPCLNSADAPSAGLFGDAVARLDPNGAFLERILAAVATGNYQTFASGYLSQLPESILQHADRLNRWLDRLENDAPLAAFYLALSAPKISRPLERTLRMIQSDRIPVHSLVNLSFGGVIFDQLGTDDLTTILDLLVRAGDPSSLHIAEDFVGRWLTRRPDETLDIAAVWRVLEASAPVDDRAGHWWTRALGRLATNDPGRACDIAISALTGRDFHKKSPAWSLLYNTAPTRPDIVMEKVGRALLDPELGWRLQTGPRSGLFQRLPFETVKIWLENAGVEGARVIAHHLAPPSADAEGKPNVAALTEYVLENWGDDERVFGSFVTSAHHLQMYTGDIASAHRKEAERARPFLSHPIPAIRRWAEREVALGEEQARQWKIQMEEQFL